MYRLKVLLLFLSFTVYSLLNAQHIKRQPCGLTKQYIDSLRIKIQAGKNSTERQRLRAAVQEQNPQALGSHAFIWPLVAAPHFYQPGFYYITNYVDLEPISGGNGNPNTLQDYNCGNRTYDTEGGYDHTGIDIGIAPFGWKGMDDGDVYVRAAEGGVIVEKVDGEFDRNCEFGESATTFGNYIALEHSDGSVTFYFHMKEGSVTAKQDGDIVKVGEYLGIVGSSGNSTGPHLHFEVQDENGSVLDPFQNGPCNRPTGVGSLWANEEPYFNKKILSVFTLELPWIKGGCDSNINAGISEIVNYKNHFSPSGDFMYISAAVRDIQQNNTMRLRVYTPSNSLLYDNTFTFSNTLGEKYVLPSQLVALPTTIGTYRLLCTYNGQNEAHFFTVGCPGAQILSGNRSSNTGVISGSTINSTETFAATVRNTEYQAETFIQMNPGFTATAGCEFRARIDDCTVGQQKPAIKNRLQHKDNNR